jgi:hypothetical protein
VKSIDYLLFTIYYFVAAGQLIPTAGVGEQVSGKSRK